MIISVYLTAINLSYYQFYLPSNIRWYCRLYSGFGFIKNRGYRSRIVYQFDNDVKSDIKNYYRNLRELGYIKRFKVV